jgi:DNA-binding transcriptional LysR family regulator
MRPGAHIGLFELQLFVSVAETGSLGQAAARHGISQPAASMRMTVLERALGLRLLQRDPSGTKLTPAGQEVLPAARNVLSASSTLEVLVSRLREEPSSTLRVAASFTVAEHLAPSWVQALCQKAPHASLTLEVINSTQVVAAVEAGRVDVGFVEGLERKLRGLVYEPITGDELVIVVAPDHPWASRREVSCEEVVACDLVLRERGSGTREVLEEALEPWGKVRSHLALGSTEAVLAAARSGQGPAVLSYLAAAPDLKAGRLRVVKVDGLNLKRTIRAVWPAGSELAPLARNLLEAAKQFKAGPTRQR